MRKLLFRRNYQPRGSQQNVFVQQGQQLILRMNMNLEIVRKVGRWKYFLYIVRPIEYADSVLFAKILFPICIVRLRLYLCFSFAQINLHTKYVVVQIDICFQQIGVTWTRVNVKNLKRYAMLIKGDDVCLMTSPLVHWIILYGRCMKEEWAIMVSKASIEIMFLFV